MSCRYVMFAAALLASTSALRAEVVNISNVELAKLLANGVPLVDVRTAGEWKSTGIIAGSRLLTFFDERGQAQPSQWLASLRGIAAPDQPVILVCRSGNRTREVSRFLSEQAKYKTVYNVTNGLSAWIAEGRSVVPQR